MGVWLRVENLCRSIWLRDAKRESEFAQNEYFTLHGVTCEASHAFSFMCMISGAAVADRLVEFLVELLDPIKSIWLTFATRPADLVRSSRVGSGSSRTTPITISTYHTYHTYHTDHTYLIAPG